MQILKLDPRALKNNPDDARRSKTSPQADALLLATVKAVGIIQPPIVAPETDGGNGYIIQAGHRRVAKGRITGEDVPAQSSDPVGEVMAVGQDAGPKGSMEGQGASEPQLSNQDPNRAPMRINLTGIKVHNVEPGAPCKISGHIVVSVILCALQCQSTDLHIWDDDTFRVGGSRGESVRIFNIDAPEIEGRCRYEIDLAQETKMRLGELLDGQRVQIRRQHKDRYGRTLAAISVNGQDVGDQLVNEGLARTWDGRREPWC